MKKVKVMLSAILVLAIVAGALAFKVKTPDVCAYSTRLTPRCPATTTCVLTHPTTTFVTTKTTAGLGCEYATTLVTRPEGVPCPNTTTICSQFKTLTIEE